MKELLARNDAIVRAFIRQGRRFRPYTSAAEAQLLVPERWCRINGDPVPGLFGMGNFVAAGIHARE
jgi:hypothetical protein